jgi:leucyl aminopeptidase
MIRIHIGASAPEGQAVVVPVQAGADPPPATRAAAAIAGFAGTLGEICEVFTPSGRVVLTGSGATADLLAAGAAGAASLLGLPRITLDARGLPPEAAATFAAGAALRAWRFDRSITRPLDDAPRLAAVDVLADAPDAATLAWRRLGAGVAGANFARERVAEPGNDLTPTTFAERLKTLTQHGIGVAVLDAAELRRQGLGALLAVGQGSANPPCLVVLRWKGTSALPPVAFVGKGITFDTGGICIKPASGMEEMKGDMAGAAAAAGAILALALRRSPCPAVAVLALAENATGAESYRPSDILRTYSGRTVEVIDTDAEGRLVLADALAWTARQQKPRAMIDLATLTGSIVTALGHYHAGLFASDAPLADAALAAGTRAGEPLWRMPIGDGHRADLDSDIADLKHCLSGRGHPDACHAAAFLREFTDGIPWLHLDIAGVSERDTATPFHAAGPTGFGVRLLDRLVADHFETA